jgi:outer membrane biosynthesis protein TonB
MPIREAPPDVNDSQGTPDPLPAQGTPASGGNGYRPAAGGSSRWVDYETHELLQVISDLEDERRMARLREGIAWAILFHILLLSAVTWIPKYILKVPAVTDPFDAIKQRKDLAYLDLPPDALRQIQPKSAPKPLREKPQVDKKTLDELNKENPPTPAPAPPPPPEQQANVEPKPQPAPPIPPNPQSQSPVDAPRPSAVPRQAFSMNSQNPEDQLRDAARNAMRSQGTQNYGAASGAMPMHPGAGTGGVQVLSDTQGVDFSSWLARWHYVTEQTWDPLIPDEVNPPILKAGEVAIRFKVLPNGRLMDGSVVLEGRSGDVALDRAAWGALVGSSYPPLPKEFHGPYLELRAYFLYNMQPQ